MEEGSNEHAVSTYLKTVGGRFIQVSCGDMMRVVCLDHFVCGDSPEPLEIEFIGRLHCWDRHYIYLVCGDVLGDCDSDRSREFIGILNCAITKIEILRAYREEGSETTAEDNCED